MVTIDDSILAFWYVEIPAGNWMASLHRDGAGTRMAYRFRYYKDQQVFDSADEKSNYSAVCPPEMPVMTLIDTVRNVVTLMKAGGAGESWELLRGTSTTRQFMDQFMALPFVHQRTATADEVAAWKDRSSQPPPPQGGAPHDAQKSNPE